MDAWEYYTKTPGIKKEWVYLKIAEEAGLNKNQVIYIINKGSWEMKVYVVMHVNYDDTWLEGVYETGKAAEKAIEEKEKNWHSATKGYFDIEEEELKSEN